MWNHRKNISDKSGVRTHEANASELKSDPFDHSGILPGFSYHDVTQMERYHFNSGPSEARTRDLGVISTAL